MTKRFDLEDSLADTSLNERLGYAALGRKMRALRSHPLAVASVLLALIMVGWLIVLNHSDDLGHRTQARIDHNSSHHLPP